MIYNVQEGIISKHLMFHRKCDKLGTVKALCHRQEASRKSQYLGVLVKTSTTPKVHAPGLTVLGEVTLKAFLVDGFMPEVPDSFW